jgi:hypothetical protein
MGYDFPSDRFERIYEEFLKVADTKQEVGEEDLRQLVTSG